MSKFFQKIGLKVSDNPYVRPYEDENDKAKAIEGWEEITEKQFKDHIKEYQAYIKNRDEEAGKQAEEKVALILSARKQIAEVAKLSPEQMAALGLG